jgi:SNF2 family DNA or RNA helicase
MSSGIRDNHVRGKVAEFLEQNIQANAKLSVVSAYFTIYAYDALKTALNKINHLDFLFGEPSFINRLDPEKTDSKQFLLKRDGLELANQLQLKRIAKECADWIREKVSIKTIRESNLLHGKMYHINNSGVEQAILGSSNFTVRGLGLGANGNNIELNLVVDGNRDRQELKFWFDELWNDSIRVEDVKEKVLEYLEQLYQNQPPEFVYYKTLFHLFEKFLADSGKTDIDLGQATLLESKIWKSLFDFQKDGVKGAINKILKYNGCILADSVGLGKTYEALAVIKYFELKNERVLILAPKRLKENWTLYRQNSTSNPLDDDRFRYDVLAHTDLSRDRGLAGDINLETINWGNYDLVVIDESHNFRNNNPGRRDEEGNIEKYSRYGRLMDDVIKKGIRSKVLLLSATPVNNSLKDLRNQIYLLTENKDRIFEESMGIPSLQELLTGAQRSFSAWAKTKSKERDVNELISKLNSAFFKLLDQLTIARSRKHLYKFYKDAVDKLGGFPKRTKPETITPEIDRRGNFLSYDKLNSEIGNYKLSLFRPSKYLKEEYKEQYRTGRRGFDQDTREEFLVGMMKINFLKRLESSVNSFEITLERTINKIKDLEQKILKYKKSKTASDSFNPEEIVLEENDKLGDEPGYDSVGKKLEYKLEHLKLDDWLAALEVDRKQLEKLHQEAKDVEEEHDLKLGHLLELIIAKAENPTKTKDGRLNRKILVFTAFADTAVYIHKYIKSKLPKGLKLHIALITGGGENQTTLGTAKFNDILTNFSPIAKGRKNSPQLPQDEEIDILIATDCISEGQNLQDCDKLVNYDIHWNPVRIIQRFGRIDRIGSQNKEVHLVNFWPTDDLNKYMNLRNRVEARMVLVDIAATAEDNVLEFEDLKDLISDDLKYRDQQLLKLKDEILDIEDLTDGASLSDFTLEDFRLELLRYIEANRAALENAGLGIHAVVDNSDSGGKVEPGVVFCLRQTSKQGKSTTSASSSDSVNPLQPYFLVYVLDDGNPRLGFANPKQILEIYRGLCVGKIQAQRELCALFDRETKDGSDMKHYNLLLDRALASIMSTLGKRIAAGLQTSRDFVIPKASEQAHSQEDFELITWLVIKIPTKG